jgi:hypothetical protein
MSIMANISHQVDHIAAVLQNTILVALGENINTRAGLAEG